MADEALFDVDKQKSTRGRVRRALDEDIAQALKDGTRLQSAGKATLRVLADQIDALDADLRGRKAKPYDRVPLTQLQHQFDDTYDRVFAGVAAAADPFLAALEEFRATEAGHTAGPGPPH